VDEHNDWLETALQPLRHPPRPHDWPSPADVQRRASRHRRQRIAAASGGTSVVLAALLVVGLVGFGSHGQPVPNTSGAIVRASGPNGSTHLVADVKLQSVLGSPASVVAVGQAEQRFALELTRLELAGAPESNIVLSPLSAHVDLSMLELGAAGATAREIATALQSSGLSPAEQAGAWNGLLQSLMGAESPGELQLANSVWVQQGLHVQATFLREAAETFGDDTYQVNFASNSSEDAINAWVAQETAGRIKLLYPAGSLSAATEVVLANALHFHAAWQRGLFQSALVRSAPFHLSSGASVSVPMIEDSQDPLSFGQTSSYDAVQLPYTNGRFAALLVEPTNGSMSAFLAGLTPKRLTSITGSLQSGYVDLSMPELKLSTLGSLDKALSAMGMAPAFSSADFTPLLGASGAANQQVGGVQQAATLDVNKWGTDAAAATGSSVSSSAAHVGGAAIAFDHPYLFLLRDTKTGAILFSSVVNNPAQA
jgi:serpin B